MSDLAVPHPTVTPERSRHAHPPLAAPVNRLLAALYTTQYLGIGFLFIGLSAILRRQGLPLETLGVIQALGLVWAVKFLWAPLVDRFGSARHGHYRSWLLVLQTLMVATLVVIATMPPGPTGMGTLFVLIAAFVLFSATQDVAADALAVRLVDTRHRGLANGIQIAGGYIGNLVGGGLTVVVYDRFGWTPAVLLLAALTATAFLLVARFREGARPTQGRSSLGAGYRTLVTVFAQPGARTWTLAVTPLFYIGVTISYTLMTPALVDIGWSLSRIGIVVSVLASVPGVIAALLGGWIIGRFGRIVPFVAGAVVSVVAVVGLVPLFEGRADDTLTTVAICLYMGGYVMSTTVLYTVNMDYSRPESAGADFTMLSSLGMVFSFVAGAICLSIAQRVGYAPVAWTSLGLLAVGTALGVRHLRGHRRFLLAQETRA